MFFPIHPDGWRFVGIFAFITFLFFLISAPLGWLGALLTLWCYFFFRNPDRVVPKRDNVIVSPADGRVVGITSCVPPLNLDLGTEPLVRVSIFLNVFDVHVNRIPMEGTIKKVLYWQGKFLNASFDKASEENERNSVVIKNERCEIGVVQIAGLIARRILCDVKEEDTVERGVVFGLIRFGSRVDLYLPVGVETLVETGQTMIAGETVIADLSRS